MAKAKEDLVTVKLPRAVGDEENFIIVMVNDRKYKIQKGVKVEVPYYVAEVLERADEMAEINAALIEKATGKE